MIRGILERMSRGVVLKRTLHTPVGKRKIFVSPESALRFWKPGKFFTDKMLYTIAQNEVKHGNVIWDIGANLGQFAFQALAVAGNEGMCLAMEPDVFLVHLMNKSARLNQDLKLDVLPAAVSNKTGMTFLNIANRSRSANYLLDSKGSTQTGGSRYTQACATVDLNFLLDNYAHPQFVKIDVEGAEGLIFQGAERLLTEVRPKILCEVFDYSAEFIADKLKQSDYILLDAATYEEVDFAPNNVLAIPNESYTDRYVKKPSQT